MGCVWGFDSGVSFGVLIRLCVFWVLISGMYFGCMCMCVLERISVGVRVLRRMRVRGMIEDVCVRGSDC